MKCVSIAIDGPAGAGKSTLARKTARELGFLYVDTGAIYRTVALKVLRAGADPTEESQVIPLLKGLDISMDYGPDGEQQMFLEGEDVSKAIRLSFTCRIRFPPILLTTVIVESTTKPSSARCWRTSSLPVIFRMVTVSPIAAIVKGINAVLLSRASAGPVCAQKLVCFH